MLAFPILLSVIMLLAIASDIRSMTIPNRLNVALVLAFALSALWAGMPAAKAGAHLLAGLGALLVTAFLFARGWMGGGDAKLIAATALWFGPTLALLDYVLLASVFGGVLTLALLGARSLVRPATGVVFLDRLLGPTNGIPYGVALGLAGIGVAVAHDWAAVFG